MKEITITTQAEYEALEETTEAIIRINGNPGETFVLTRNLKRTRVQILNGTIHCISGGTIQYVCGGTIQYVLGNATISIYRTISLGRITQQATIILYDDAELRAEYISSSMAVVRRTTRINNTLETLKEVFGLEPDEKGNLTCFKARNPETKCDFWTGTIKYEGHVVCPDWDPDPNRECGGGLHVSPLPGLAQFFSPDGEVVAVRVKPENIVVYASDINKIRVRELDVIEG